MKLFEKIRTFKESLIYAYHEITRDRDTARVLLDNAILIRDRYKLLSTVATEISKGIYTIIDCFSRYEETKDSDLVKTLLAASGFLKNYITVSRQKGDDPEKYTLSYLLEYNRSHGEAYDGISEIFLGISDHINTHIELIKEKIGRRDFAAAIRQYSYMCECVTEECACLGINDPKFLDINLDKYNS